MHFLNLHWEHHTWHKRVTAAESIQADETSIWGRPVHRDFVRCQKQQVCEKCGKIRDSQFCICDEAHAEQCAIRCAWIDRAH